MESNENTNNTEKQKLGSCASMTQAAAILKIDFEEVQRAKNRGCRAIQSNGRVNLDQLSEWIVRATIEDELRKLSASHHKIRLLRDRYPDDLKLITEYLRYVCEGINAISIILNPEEAAKDGFTLPPPLPRNES